MPSETPTMHPQMHASVDKLYREAQLARAKQLEMDADLLYYSLLAHSMTERTMRAEAKTLRESAERVAR